MELSEILSIGSSVANVAGGSLFGFVGAITGQVSKYFQTKQDHKQQEKAWQHELKLLDIQSKQKAIENDFELSKLDEIGSQSGLLSSINHDIQLSASTHKWVTDIKSLYRPALTTILILVTSYLFHSLYTDAFQIANKEQLISYIVYSVVFSTATAITWWFGDRALAMPKHK